MRQSPDEYLRSACRWAGGSRSKARARRPTGRPEWSGRARRPTGRPAFFADDSPPVAAVEPARLRSRTQSSQALDQDRIYLPTVQVDQDQEHGDLPVGLSGQGGRGDLPVGLHFFGWSISVGCHCGRAGRRSACLRWSGERRLILSYGVGCRSHICVVSAERGSDQRLCKHRANKYRPACGTFPGVTPALKCVTADRISGRWET